MKRLSLLCQFLSRGKVARGVDVGYDNFFRVKSLSVNGANPVSFGYDDDGLLVQAGDLTLARDSLNGRLTGTTLGNVSDSWTYNGFGEAQNYSASAGNVALYSVNFTRDNAGRITTKTETIGGVTSIYSYTYDPARGWQWQRSEPVHLRWQSKRAGIHGKKWYRISPDHRPTR